MTIEVSYSQARQKLASLLDEVTQDKEVVIINRRGGEPAALIAADELVSLTETAHLLRSQGAPVQVVHAAVHGLLYHGLVGAIARGDPDGADRQLRPPKRHSLESHGFLLLFCCSRGKSIKTGKSAVKRDFEEDIDLPFTSCCANCSVTPLVFAAKAELMILMGARHGRLSPR